MASVLNLDETPRTAAPQAARPIFLHANMTAEGRRIPNLPRISRQRYVSPEYFQAEIDHVFRKSWLLLGHICEYEKKGSYQLFDLPFGPVILMRGEGSEMRAFLNSCPHRGATVLKEASGCARVMSCQYHGWTYNLEGRLIGIANAEAFPGVDKSQFALPRLRCEQWGGLIYINFDPDAPPLHQWLGPVIEANPQIAEVADRPVRLQASGSWDVACNWKLMYENFIEGYHLDFVHANSVAALIDQSKYCFEVYANGCANHYSFYQPPEKMNWAAEPQTLDVPSLASTEGMDEFDQRFITTGMFPNTTIPATRQWFNIFEVLPLGVDRCRFAYRTYVSDWGDGPMPEDWARFDRELQNVAEEDIATMPMVQKSIEADPLRDVPLGGFDIPIFQFNARLDQMIGADNLPEGCAISDPEFLDPWLTG